MIINSLEPNLSKIISFMAISPGSRFLRKEIKEKTQMNNVPLDSSLNKLITLKLINKNKNLYSLNIQNEIVDKIVNEIKEKIPALPFKIQLILLEFIEELSKLKSIKRAVLFGSYAKIIFSEKSDIDIAIIIEEKLKNQYRHNLGKKVNIISNKISKKYKKQIHEHFFTNQDLKHKEDPLIKDILKNGIELL